MDAMTLLTLGLLIFAAAQVWVQHRSEETRKLERKADADESIDRAFHIVWAEHFRLEGLTAHLKKADLIEMAFLGVLKPEDVLPRDWAKITEALAALSREAGYLGGVALTLAYDIEREIGIFTNSVCAFAKEAPKGRGDAECVRWLRKTHGPDLAPWEASVRKNVDQLSRLFWDAASHNPRAKTERLLNFSDDMSSDIGKAAVGALLKRAKAIANPTDEEKA